VDDDKGVRYFLTRFLKQKGYKEVQSAATGKEALKIIDEDRIKIVLLDIRLPGMDGVEVLRKIKARDKDIGVIMITGFPDEKIGQQCLELGASDYIMKPFDLAYLELNVLTKIVTMT
jgi:two-component system response regulator (stage 0 sporulation protein F)